MKATPHFEFPAEQEAIYRKARKLEWLCVAYIASAAVAMFITMGSSQAMRTSFFEDVISVVPSLAFLIGTKIARRRPCAEYPYGYHRATSIAYLTSALALLGMGLFLVIEGGLKLVTLERTSIGGMKVAGHVVWAGWPMLAAISYSAIPAVFFGRVKLKLAGKIHNKVLQAQADMMKADWLAESATAIGVLGVGLGYWWVDPIAGCLVALDICKDGVVNVKTAIADLIDRKPKTVDGSKEERLPQGLQNWLTEQPWVAQAEVRLREEGHVFFGEAFVVPRVGETDLPRLARETMENLKKVDWRLHDVSIALVDRL